MTPAECQPGTIVMYPGCAGEQPRASVIVKREELYPDAWYLELKVDGWSNPNEVVVSNPADLQLAPRFLVGGEWQTTQPEARDAFATSQWCGSIHWNVLVGWVYDLRNGNSVERGLPAFTYLAARQAVERACGIGGRDGE